MKTSQLSKVSPHLGDGLRVAVATAAADAAAPWAGSGTAAFQPLPGWAHWADLPEDWLPN